MSLVSEAHRRANGEALVEESSHKSIPISWWLLSVILALALGSAVTVWYHRADSVAEHSITSKDSRVAVREEAKTNLPSEPPLSDESVDPAQPESSSSVMALYDRARVERESRSQQVANPIPSSSANQPAAKEVAESRPSAALEPPTRASSIDEEQLLARAESLLASSQRDAVLNSALPTLETLSEDDRDSVPTLLYSAHDYRTEGGSKVMINREWWSEGQQVSGIKVVEIRAKSTVFETQNGTRFVQPALSSWVNL